MSHFCVIVIGNDVEDQMERFAEQDFAEEYGFFEDTEDENLEEYQNKEVEIVVFADGSLHSKYEEQFREYDPKNFSSNYVYPKGSIIRPGKFTELYSTFEEFMEEWHGTPSRDENKGRYGYWHNPNAHYDWYSVGGRWTGYFKPKNGSQGMLGVPGAFDNKAKEGWVDMIHVGDIDVEGMKKDAEEEANTVYDKLEEALKGRPLPSWNAVFNKNEGDVDRARAEYHSLPTVKDLNAANLHVMGDYVEVFGNSREEYIEKCKNSVMVPYAVVKDGEWYQKGEMGWWGMSHDEVSQDEWNKQFWEMINSLPPDTELTLLDCHI